MLGRRMAGVGLEWYPVCSDRIDSRFSRLYLMFGITMVAVTIAVVQKLFG